jgi:hypothetical protein
MWSKIPPPQMWSGLQLFQCTLFKPQPCVHGLHKKIRQIDSKWMSLVSLSHALSECVPCASVLVVCHAQAMVVTELCSGGDLAKAMRRARRTRAFGWYMRGAKIALDVACGLAYLHKQGVSSPPSICERTLLCLPTRAMHCVVVCQEHRRTPEIFAYSPRYTHPPAHLMHPYWWSGVRRTCCNCGCNWCNTVLEQWPSTFARRSIFACINS